MDDITTAVDFGWKNFFASLVLGFVLFSGLNLLIKKSRFGHNWLHKKTERHQWIWRNIFCSMIHASITGLATSVSFYQTPALFFDLKTADNLLGKYAVAFFFGYALYDSLDIFFNDLSDTIILFHHFVSMSIFSIALSGNYLAVALLPSLSEVHSVFLHARRLCKLTDNTNGVLFKMVQLFNYFTLVTFRTIPSAYCSLWCIMNFFQSSWIANVLFAFGVVMINSQNWHLAVSLYKADFIRK